MIAVTATQAARTFATILDAVEHGETVVITRAGFDQLTGVRAEVLKLL